MESDDLYDSFSPPKEASPQLHHRRLKRLKKATGIIDAAPSQPMQADLLASSSIFSKLEALERSEVANKDYSPNLSNSESFDADIEFNSDLVSPAVDRKEAKRSLDFGVEHDDVDESFVDRGDEKPVEGNSVEDSDVNVSKAKKRNFDESKGKKKKKEDRSEGNDVKPKTSSSNKRREEKERREYLQLLHAESQKLLRETSGAAFKPIPIVHKPIGSVLEKIRQRKLEMLKKSASASASASVNSLNNPPSEGLTRDYDPSDSVQFQRVDKSEEIDGVELGACCADMKNTSIDETDMDVCKVPVSSSKDDSHNLQMVHDEPQPLLQPRAPLDDTEDLFDNDEMPRGQKSTLEEPLGISPLLMELKFDSALSNDICSDEEEEYNDKENIVPDILLHDSTSGDGDLLRQFVDDEAVEEDDSDNDMRFQDDEDDEIDDYEDLKDLIATGYEEEKADLEKRNELHQKWLEQQDSFGTDNLLQKLGCGSKVRESTTLLEEEEDESSDDESAEDLREGNLSKGKTKKKKMRLMIPEMFPDKDETYSSDDETETRLAKQRILIRAEKEVTLLPPIEDENSRDVFGLIKKLNTIGDAKKNVKTSFFDKLLIGGNSNSSSKTSFLGRASSHSLPAAKKKGTGNARSYIFCRDDSNSRSSITIPTEDSSEAIETEHVMKKKVTRKFISSTSSSQRIITTESVSNPTSLLEMLKVQQSKKQQSLIIEEDNMVGLTQTALAAFKIRKRPFNTQGRK
ncbi:AT-rich interactive domain-containing protein 4B [Impatiens glandulifera]|uniref:AT-rich interactive domain-containing protein 4B n=1 Tax=Impatiens glandulifera TaxID=253017 RepID=UPI001FB06DD6|nr:AT-rich interactive domain-containing protein 4B [Impatiens glandulifera]